MFVGVLLLTTLGIIPPYWVICLGLGLLAVGYGLTNPPRVAALMSSAPDDVAGAASSSNSVGVESGSGAGIALSTTLAVTFAGRAFLNMGTKAGLSPEEIQRGVDTLRSAMNDFLVTPHQAIPQAVIDQLYEGARNAYAIGLAQTMILLTLVCAISGLIIWFGMRQPPSNEKNT